MLTHLAKPCYTVSMLEDQRSIKETYEYMRAEDQLQSPVDLIFIFGNGSEQQLLADKAVHVYHQQQALGASPVILCTGGIGKGSIRLDIPEATLLRDQLVEEYKIPSTYIFTETNSHNAGDNCRNGMVVIVKEGLSHDRIALVANSISMRRMRAVFELEASIASFKVRFFNCPTDKLIDTADLAEKSELFTELLKVVDWPRHSPKWSQEQEPAPSKKLVAYAREYSAKQSQ
jgi:hypothetical protein